MPDRKLIQLLESLKQATLEGRVHWSETDGESAFKIRLGDAVLELDKDDDEDVDLGYVVTLKDSKGKTLDLEFFSQNTFNQNYYSLVDELYSLARRDALKIETILDSMIDVVQRSKMTGLK